MWPPKALTGMLTIFFVPQPRRAIFRGSAKGEPDRQLPLRTAHGLHQLWSSRGMLPAFCVAMAQLLTSCVANTSSNKVLVELGKTQDSSARKLDEKALMLLGEILHLSDILMPASQCANIQVTCYVSFACCELILIPSFHL